MQSTGVAGYIATMLSPDIVPELLPFYIQCGTTLLMFIISICETVIIVTLVRWMKCKLNINKRGRNETVNHQLTVHIINAKKSNTIYFLAFDLQSQYNILLDAIVLTITTEQHASLIFNFINIIDFVQY